MEDIQFTKNFSLFELLVTEHRGFDNEQYNPSTEIIENLRSLSIHILQPLRDISGTPIKVNSGYRCRSLNKAIGGAKTSQHTFGMAADIIDFTHGNEFLFNKIKELNLPFDQLIDELNFRWVHVSYDLKRNRKQILQARKNTAGKMIYTSAK